MARHLAPVRDRRQPDALRRGVFLRR
jgi:hypothetical protein